MLLYIRGMLAYFLALMATETLSPFRARVSQDTSHRKRPFWQVAVDTAREIQETECLQFPRQYEQKTHDAVMNELRDYLRSAGACVLLEPVNVLPHAHNLDPSAQLQGELFGPDLQVTLLDSTGERYLIVTTVDMSSKTYRADARNRWDRTIYQATTRSTLSTMLVY